MGEVAQLITAIGGALGVVLTPVVTLLIARGRKSDDDEAQNRRIAELERLLAERDVPRHRRKGDRR